MKKRNFYKIGICLVVILIIHFTFMIYYGSKKAGFHDDEYFTFWSSAGNHALKMGTSYEWYKGINLLLRYTVSPNNRFAFPQVVQNQAMDVHPPLYYLTLNIIMSIRAGSFSKWYGLLLNELFILVSLLGCFYFIYRLSNGRWGESAISTFLLGIAPFTISNIMFIRMYAMTVMWNMLYAVIILEVMKCPLQAKKRFAILTVLGGILCYLSFLTHYFCLLMPFCLTVGYVIYTLFQKRGILRMFLYGGTMIIMIGLAILSFPASLSHIFSGYRGKGALSGLRHSSLKDMVKLFFPILSKNFYDGWLIAVFVLTLVALVVFCLRSKDSVSKWFLVIGQISCILSTLFLSKTSLLLGDSSSRYFYAVGSLYLCLSAHTVLQLASLLWENKKTLQKITLTLCVLFLVFPQLKGHLDQNVLFLYRDNLDKLDFSRSYSQYPLIMVYSSDTYYRVEYTADQIWQFEDVLFWDVNAFNSTQIDEKLKAAEKIVVYIDAPEEYLTFLVECCPNITSCRLVRHDPFYYAYLLE